MLTIVSFFQCSGPWEARELASSGILISNLVLPASDKKKYYCRARTMEIIGGLLAAFQRITGAQFHPIRVGPH